jgi:coenzyme F420-reducing hydrogenase beta subunit
MAKAAPFSKRLSDITDQLVSEEARRTRRTKGAVVEALTEEALRTRRFPGIVFRGSDWNRRPWVIGTALDVWEIVAASRSFGTSVEMVAATNVSEPHIRLALAYDAEFPEEIDAAIAENERPPAELQRQYPTIDTIVAGE